ncbi:MAG TPA: hypothetical protein VH583_00555 [Vicinamibacterales bacterium]|jgi:hypothetical protein
MRKALGIVALFAFLFVSPTAEPRSGAVSLAIVRRDGVLIPFAVFDGKRWNDPWPPPQVELEVPINVASVPKGWWGDTGPVSDWHLWTMPASAPQTIHVTQPTWIPVHCVRQIGLQSDYRSSFPIPPPEDEPYAKDGIAISSADAISPVTIVPPQEAELGADFVENFNHGETVWDRRYGHPVSKRVREHEPPTVEALYRFGTNPTVSYIEASRQYHGKTDDSCTAMAFGTGWLVGGKSQHVFVDVLQCDKYGASYMLPFGVLRVAGRSFWIAQFSSWDDERYAIVEIKKDRMETVMNAWGGGC